MKYFQKLVLPVLLLTISMVLLEGCNPLGYTARSQCRPGVETVCVPMWTRGTNVYRRNSEIQLTEAIVKCIELNTTYKVTNKGKADTILTGTITSIEQKSLGVNPDTDTPRGLMVRFTVSFRWKDLRTGKEILSEDDFTVTEVYHPSAPYNEEFFRGSKSLMEKMARRIVEKMNADW